MIAQTDKRRAGALLHITSLPNSNGSGHFGQAAYNFVDWLNKAGFCVWQVLPLGPTHNDGSPYLSLSAFAGNPAFIDFDLLREDAELNETWFKQVLADLKEDSLPALEAALLRYQRSSFSDLPEAMSFLRQNEYWLQDFAQFMTLRIAQKYKPWWEWPETLRGRDPHHMRQVLIENKAIHRAVVIEQYLFQRQWLALKNYASQQGIQLFGDLPLYVSHDSADTWANRRFFALDELGQATAVAGAPPDMFCEEGQRWGNPVYNWAALAHDEFSWWVDRLKRQFDLFDLIRIDHFRGLEAYWQIPNDAEFASAGHWEKTPGDALLQTLRNKLGDLPLIAEDLGFITEEVHTLREKYHLPSMRVLQFGFDGTDDNPHLAKNLSEQTVVYTGTHDNDTVVSWFDELHLDAQNFIRHKLGMNPDDSILDTMIHTALHSVSELAVLPVQDILGLGAGARMNTPGTMENNWSWQLQAQQLTTEIAEKFRAQNSAAQRCE